MAIVLVFDSPGMTQEDYDSLIRLALPDGAPPPGLLYHVAGATEGGWQMIEVWESPEAAKRFSQERLLEAIQATGVQISLPKTFSVHNVLAR